MSPNINDLKQSKFLTKHDVEPAILVTITGYEEANVAMEGAEPQMKWTLTFKELEKPMVLNMTNGQILAALTGSGEFKDWISFRVVLYNDPNITFGGKLVGGIRCRAPRKQFTEQQKKELAEASIPEPDPSITENIDDSSIPF